MSCLLREFGLGRPNRSRQREGESLAVVSRTDALSTGSRTKIYAAGCLTRSQNGDAKFKPLVKEPRRA